MLHILLLLLKIIGIIIASVFGILLLFILLLLFTPLHYEITGNSCENLNSLKLNAQISFFVRLIRIKMEYQENELYWKICLAWKKISNETSSKQGTQKQKTLESKTTESKVPDSKTTDSKVSNSKTSDSKVSDSKISDSKVSECETQNYKASNHEATKHEATQKADAEQKSDYKTESFIEKFIEKLKCTFTKIYDMITLLKEKTDAFMDFFNNETHRTAFLKALIEIKRLLKKLKPKKLNGTILFGFEDPSVTGKVLGGISILYPYIQDNLTISADFETKRLSGDLFIKGRIRVSMFLTFLFHMIINKDVRITFRNILKLINELKQGGK